MTIPDPFLDTASQRQATGMDVGARKLMLEVIRQASVPSTTLQFFFDGQFADIDDYLEAVEEVWGYAIGRALRATLIEASAERPDRSHS